MNLKRLMTRLGVVFLTILLFSGCSGERPVSPAQAETQTPVIAQTPRPSSSSVPTASVTDEDREAEDKAQESVQEQSLEKQRKIVSEAVTALHETYFALEFLSQSKPQEALAAVEKAIGKLEVVLAREPSLALAPISTVVRTDDLIADPSDVEKLVKEAEELLEDGKVQQARLILGDLASETLITTTSIPLGTYPDALKSAAKSIDNGQLEEAASVLNEALSTQVVTDVLIPLPLARAEAALNAAEELAEKSDRTKEESAELNRFLDSAEKSARLAEALGYGTKADFKIYFDEVEQLRDKTSGGKSGEGFFDNIKDSLKNLGEQARWLEV